MSKTKKYIFIKSTILLLFMNNKIYINLIIVIINITYITYIYIYIYIYVHKM